MVLENLDIQIVLSLVQLRSFFPPRLEQKTNIEKNMLCFIAIKDPQSLEVTSETRNRKTTYVSKALQ